MFLMILSPLDSFLDRFGRSIPDYTAIDENLARFIFNKFFNTLTVLLQFVRVSEAKMAKNVPK